MFTELLQRQYDFELEQRNSLASSINIPIVAATVISSAISVMALDYQYSASIGTYFFIFAIVSVAISIAYSISFIFKSFLNYEYKKLPSSTSLRHHYGDLINWHKDNSSPSDEPEKLARHDFDDYLNKLISEAADWNSINNIRRGNYLHVATQTIAISTAMLILPGSFYIYNKVSAPDKIAQVKIIQFANKPIEVTIMSDNTTNNAPASAPLQAPISSTKPVGPSNQTFKGNTEIPKPNLINNQKK